MKTMIRAAVVLLTVIALAACGDDDETVNSNADAPSDGAAGACLEGSEDCDDTPSTSDGDDDAVDEHALIEEAKALVGTAEDDVADDVRIGRRGDESFALTDDYVIGRMTVELDPDDSDTMRVTKVVLELTEGPMTFPES